MARPGNRLISRVKGKARGLLLPMSMDATPWRAVVVGGLPAQWPGLAEVVAGSGGTVVGSSEGGDGAGAFAEGLRPDVVIVAPAGGAADLEAARVLAERARCAVLVLAEPSGGRSPLVGWVVRPVRAGELVPALGASTAPLAELAGLRDEVQALQRRLDGRKLVERAKGALMERLGLTEPEAFRRIQKTAMDTRRTMGAVAQAILLSDQLAREGRPAPGPAHAVGTAPLEVPAS
jgi:response regulator NasT